MSIAATAADCPRIQRRTELLDSLITEAILRTYKRAAIRPSNPIPAFSNLRNELARWRDEDKKERVMDEAASGAIKLRS